VIYKSELIFTWFICWHWCVTSSIWSLSLVDMQIYFHKTPDEVIENLVQTISLILFKLVFLVKLYHPL